MGVKIPDNADTSATIISSVGCPMGCNFCTTSAFFGGKGKILNLYSTGEELFRLMEEAEAIAQREIVLHHGREFSPPEAARHGPARAHEGRRQELGVQHLLFGERHPEVQL